MSLPAATALQKRHAESPSTADTSTTGSSRSSSSSKKFSGFSMQSILSRGKAFLTPNASSTNLAKQSNGVQTVKSATALFPAVDPAIDGDDCLKDCDSCTVSLPRKWDIDESDKLYGHVKGWDTHVIVATGKTDWVRDVVDEKGSLMQKIGDHGLQLSNGKVMLSASDMPTGNDHDDVYAADGRTRCLILPKWSMIEGIDRTQVDWLMDEVVGKGASNLSPLDWKQGDAQEVEHAEPQNNGIASQPEQSATSAAVPAAPSSTLATAASTIPPSIPTPATVSITSCPHRAVILMCSHKTRDWRCGASAPLLRKEFERHLRPLGLYRDLHDERPGGVGIYFINHVGGHKYSANVMIYRREGSNTATAGSVTAADQLSEEAVQGIWLARVRPEDCENIVKHTILQGKLVKPMRQLRGGFDRGQGLISW